MHRKRVSKSVSNSRYMPFIECVTNSIKMQSTNFKMVKVISDKLVVKTNLFYKILLKMSLLHSMRVLTIYDNSDTSNSFIQRFEKKTTVLEI